MPRNLPPYIWTDDLVIQFADEDLKCYTGQWDGVPAWSNGHVIFKGDPPIDGEPMTETMSQRAVGQAPLTAEEIFPVATSKPEWASRPYVFFSDGVTVVAARYFYYAVAKYPDARFYGDGSKPVLIRDSGIAVALIMRIDCHDNEWPAGVKEFLC